MFAYDLVREFNPTMKSRAAYAKVESEGKYLGRVLPNLIDSFNIYPGEKILIVDDCILPGENLINLEEIIKSNHGRLMGVLSIVTFCEEARKILIDVAERNEAKVKVLVDFNWNCYDEDMCPLDGDVEIKEPRKHDAILYIY